MFAVLLFGPGEAIRSEPALPQTQLKAYPLPVGTKSADISPDEQYVVTDAYEKNYEAREGTNPYSDLIQLWNFKQERLIGKFSTLSPDVRLYTRAVPGGYTASIPLGVRLVRFAPDGRTVAALIGHTIHLLASPDLKEVRTISLVPPANVTEKHHGKPYVSQLRVCSMELSPTGDTVAVLWAVQEMFYGKLQLYDLSTSALTASWDAPTGWISCKELLWAADGKVLLLNIHHRPSTTDVFAFDPQTGAIKHEIKTGLGIGGFAISPGNRVLTVETGSPKLLNNREPQLSIFDLNSGKLVREIPGGSIGRRARYFVSVSADGSRCLAFTGDLKKKFDWGDLDMYSVVIDETFSIWSLATYDEIFTSQNIPGLHHSTLKLSPRGNFVLSYGKANFVYELP
jgi:WD40 repeat protein